MKLKHYLGHIRQAETPDALWKLVLAFYFSRSGRMVSYRYWTRDADSEEAPQIVQVGFPEAFVERFFREKLYEHNPISDFALQTAAPFYWSDTARLAGLSEEERGHLHNLTEGLPGEGLIIQAFGPNGRAGTFNVGFEEGAARLSVVELNEWQAAAQVAHLSYCSMTLASETASLPELTAREIEVLEWIAKGKSNSVIASILGISSHTVDTHVRRIFAKLKVNDRTTAAVKGVGAGLLHAA